MTAQNGRTMPVTLGQCMETHARLDDEIVVKLDKRTGFYRWVIGLIVVAILTLTGTGLASWVTTRERLSSVEAYGEQREKRLIRMEDKLDRLLQIQSAKQERE